MKRTIAAVGIALMALLGASGCTHHRHCPPDVSVYYVPGC